MDPLHDPDDEELLHPRQARELAGVIETARMASGAVRNGSIGRVGAARVVLNNGNPLTGGNHACALWGTLAEVARTLLHLEETFAEAERAEAVVYASPTTVAEIEGIADDAGWRAVEENVALLYRMRQEPAAVGRGAQPRTAREADVSGMAELLADEAGLSSSGESRLARNLGHRLDDPRCVLSVVDDPGGSRDADAAPEVERLAGFAMGFVEHGVGLVEQVVARPGRRGRGIGRTLVADIVAHVRERGARMIAAHAEEGGSAERFAEVCGFEAVYAVTAYARRVDELLD
ncbi:GNAT family N-acetyltransferase [Haloactinomyces albus]|uniref:GNAT superfamily N-acetyltransferase n=1 Tax=Haloactinomyces albus TaxID=1352928 RepID=A0AAE3ZDJ3_9ACTN|nr:GNAT family N-acetyltransferase [Haloactinomyces albus]MDR7302927.1 GNAT superfamily N-acetyltransferase [Haloactinomyces albus]